MSELENVDKKIDELA